ncbi:MAG: 4-vinyl reductase [archaeon]
MQKKNIETSGAISFKVIATRDLKFENGELSIWNVKGSIFANAALAYLAGAINKRNMKDVADAIYWMGYSQAVGAVLMTTQRFGFKNQVLDTIFSQGRILGYGIVYIKNADLAKGEGSFSMKGSVAKEYFALFGKADKPICHHMRGLFAGALGTLSKKDVVCIEEQCVAMGHPACVFSVKPLSKINKSENAKFQIPKKFPSPKELGAKEAARQLKQSI